MYRELRPWGSDYFSPQNARTHRHSGCRTSIWHHEFMYWAYGYGQWTNKQSKNSSDTKMLLDTTRQSIVPWELLWNSFGVDLSDDERCSRYVDSVWYNKRPGTLKMELRFVSRRLFTMEDTMCSVLLQQTFHKRINHPCMSDSWRTIRCRQDVPQLITMPTMADKLW